MGNNKLAKAEIMSKQSEKVALLVLGNQLFEPKHFSKQKVDAVFIREDFELCTYFKFHKQKIVFFLAAMRAYASELTDTGFNVHYEELKKSEKTYEIHFLNWIKKESINKIILFEIEDKFFEKRILKSLELAKIKFEILPSPMFLTSRDQFKTYLGKTKRPFMKTFYESQRKRLKIMVDPNDKPLGGQWSFDEENRKPLPKTVNPPEIEKIEVTPFIKTAIAVVQKNFSDHPGELNDYWLPVDRIGAKKWLKKFLDERLAFFGPYEDAMTDRSDFVFHSVLTPFLNTGLLTPEDVVRAIITVGNKKKLNITSIEGIIRQVIGWREFIRGIYQSFSEKQDTTNFWNHQRKLNKNWYDGTTGIEPLDQVIKKVNRLGYAHHIERLMIVSNMMLLLEVDPKEVHRWFMEMFIDSSDWVMGPNVYGMGQFSDGGIFATKPYICGSNYYRKMGGFKKADWCEAVDGLYWSFIEKHKDFFMKNPRLSMMARTVEKMDPKRKTEIFSAAKKLRERITSLD